MLDKCEFACLLASLDLLEVGWSDFMLIKVPALPGRPGQRFLYSSSG